MSKRAVLIKALAATPGDLERMVRGLADTAVIQKPDPSQWSISDVLCHLNMVEERYLARLQLVVNEERPLIPTIHPDEASHNLSRPLATMLAEFKMARETTLDFLGGLKLGQWQRTAVHETWGVVKFRYLVQQLVEHDTNHLNQIIEIMSSKARS